ncbi:sulfatase [Rubellicoccus peritrichatus]|uniref:Sulfatase n=1 Tax=Rubellicoccus peritrichatus TaxID=3080537 RepID=A0AAQ3L7G7_9BACT|nr:sulfatase [Puniceicoccus sp. CR14]WOO41024.1 sulfatase [Puniceicoccus sp. CR14]
MNLHATVIALLFVLGLTAHGSPKPNVLFLSVDDLKPTLGIYGDSVAITPNIDKLGNNSTVMLNNYCQMAVCAPSRMSMFTGLRPDSTKVWNLRTQLLDVCPDAVTMQELFKNNGYVTAGSGKVMHGAANNHPKSWSVPFTSKKDLPYAKGYPVPAHDNAFYQGEKEQAAFKAMNDAGIRHWKERMTWMAERGAQPSTENLDVPDDAYVDGALASWAISQLEDYAQSKEPFFLTIGFTKPHLPFAAPRKYWDLYDRDKIELAEFRDHAANTPDFVYHKYGELRSYSDISRDFNQRIEDDKARELIHGYYACVSFVDAQIGRVLDKLDELGLAENTIVVLWGDHGWHLGDHDMWCKHSNFEEATRSPLIIHAPGYKPGRTESMTEFVDIFPTLVQLANLKEPYPLEGVSLVPLLENPNSKVKYYAMSQYPRQNRLMGYAMRTDRYRYVMWMRANWRSTMPFDPSLVEFVELYDYKKDPLETVNQADNPGYKETAAALNAMMLEYFKTYEQQPAPTLQASGAGVKPGHSNDMIKLSEISLDKIQTRFATVNHEDDDLVVQFENSPKWPSIDFMAGDETPWDLSDYDAIDISLTNQSTFPLNTFAYVTNAGDTHANKKRNGSRLVIPAGATKMLRIEFDPKQYPLDLANLNSLRIFVAKLKGPATLRINSIKAVKSNSNMATPSNTSLDTTSQVAVDSATIDHAGNLLDLSQVTSNDVRMRFAQISPGSNAQSLTLDFELSPKWPSIEFFKQDGNQWNLRGYQSVQINLTNESTSPVKTFALIANEGDSQQTQKRCMTKETIAPGENKTLSIRIKTTNPDFDPSQVTAVRVFIGMHKAPVKLQLNSIKVL